MSDCISCTKKGKERSQQLDLKRVEAKNQAYEQQKTMAICKKTKEGQFFICSAEDAIREKYFVVDTVSYLR